jgi:geminin
VLAEKRRVALLETVDENVELHERLAKLEDELNLSHQMLEETRNLVEVLTEMLQENEDSDANVAEAAPSADDEAETANVADQNE